MKKTYTNFDDLVSSMKDCTKCALRQTCNRVVPGAGNSKAKIVFIGEGPGKKEDELGVPFVGAAGKFLDEMLTSIGLDRDSVYIANIVKCRPPENRDPLPEEATACRPWLMKQLSMIDPVLIITLGRHSMHTFLSELKISEAHGQAYNVMIPELDKEKTILTLYHPAAALYNGSMRATLMKDFAKIPKLIENVEKGK